MAILREYDVVRVVRLRTADRFYDGSEGVMRPPAVGDIATICDDSKPNDPLASVVVEMVNDDGMTIWLADFTRDELDWYRQKSEPSAQLVAAPDFEPPVAGSQVRYHFVRLEAGELQPLG